MQADTSRRPYLVRGDALIRFLDGRRQSKKQKCAPTEFFCFKCRVPREAYEGIADLKAESPHRFRVKVICAICSTRMSKIQDIRNLHKFESSFHVQQRQEWHLIEGFNPSVNSDRRRSAKTAEQARHAIDRLESYTGFKDFGTFNKDHALAFKRHLLTMKGQRSGKAMSLSTVHHTLQAVKEFLAWLHGRQEYRNRIKPSDFQYLNLTTGEERQAHTTHPKIYATPDQYRAALLAMPSTTEIERRDRAVMALLLLTGMRDAALVSLKIKHISVERNHVFQDPRQVATKFSKPIETFFYPVGDDVAAIVHDWVNELTKNKLFGSEDPLFPKTLNGQDKSKNFMAAGLSRNHWTNATPVRKIFKAAYECVGLPYFPPHTVRNTLTQLAYKLNLTPEQFKAWSQNMGHDKPLTTLNSYGHVSTERQAEIINGLSTTNSASSPNATAEKINEIHAMLKQIKA